MFETMTLKRILKNYESIFSDILFGFEFVSIENNKINFKDCSGNQMLAIVNNNIILKDNIELYKDDENTVYNAIEMCLIPSFDPALIEIIHMD